MEIRRNAGVLKIAYEAPPDHFAENLALATDLIERETRRGEFSAQLFNETIAFDMQTAERFDGDSGTLMGMADYVHWVANTYPQTKYDGPSYYQILKSLGRERFLLGLKKLFDPDMKIQIVKRPPYLFRFEGFALFIVSFAFWGALWRRVFSKNFRHDRVRWVRKLKFPPGYWLEISIYFLIPVAAFLPFGLSTITIGRIWRGSLLAGTAFFSEYIPLFFLTGIVLCVAQCMLASCYKKVMAVDDSLWIKSMGYFSIVIPFSAIREITVVRPFALLLSPRTLFRIGPRVFYYNLWFWQPGLLVTLTSGKAYFLGVTDPVAASAELDQMIRKHTQKPTANESIEPTAA